MDDSQLGRQVGNQVGGTADGPRHDHEGAPDRFTVGDRVKVLADARHGNPRTPRYVRGRIGTVVRAHGVVVNPLDHAQPYPPLYSVVFPLRELPGVGAAAATGHDEVLADLHADWLSSATGAG